MDMFVAFYVKDIFNNKKLILKNFKSFFDCLFKLFYKEDLFYKNQSKHGPQNPGGRCQGLKNARWRMTKMSKS